MQRALMQYYNPANHRLVLQALKKAQRDDLIGWGANCLIPPYLREHKKDAKSVPKAVNKKSRPSPQKTDHGAKNGRPPKHGGKSKSGGRR